jgi:hypothetical protein
VRQPLRARFAPSHSHKTEHFLMPALRTPLTRFARARGVSLLALAALGMPAAAWAGNYWQPLCPDGAVCATTTRAFAANGRVLFPAAGDDMPAQWVDLATLQSIPTTMRDVELTTPSGKYVFANGPQFAAYDAGGNLLYSYTHTSIETWTVVESLEKPLGPALYVPANGTILSGLTPTVVPPTIYLTRDEGQTMSRQTANVKMNSGRTSFALAPDGAHVWANPGPITAGLWQTPAVAANAAPDFTHLTRLDDGSFPRDVFDVRVIGASALLPGGYAVALSTDGLYLSTNAGVTWTRGGFGGIVDDIVFPAPGNPDLQVVAARNSVFISRDRGASWDEIGHDLPGDRYALTAVSGGIVADGIGGVFWCSGLDCNGPAFGKLASAGSVMAQVTEFYNTALDHYFMTADEDEKAGIRSGTAGAGWIETGQSFWAWTPTYSAASAFVCRFYGDLVKGPNSHFYSASTDECRSLLDLQERTPASQPRWNSEGYAFKVSLPLAGQCATGLTPVYRAYNDGFAHGVDSNHRYAVDRNLLAPLIARGWKDEGIAFCASATGG